MINTSIFPGFPMWCDELADVGFNRCRRQGVVFNSEDEEVDRLNGTKRKLWVIGGERRWGFERSTIFLQTEKYMDRWILYVAGYTLRLHKFYRGDDDKAPHDHPWPFITFPFVTYEEDVPNKYGTRVRKTVKGWRFHFRPAEYRHIVKGRVWKFGGPQIYGPDTRPFWTFVMTGRRQRTWGFWPKPDRFIDWRLW